MADEAVSVALTPVESSQVSEIGYESGSLFVRFKHGGSLYRYSDVPYGVFQEFMAAESKGKFLATEIKTRFAFEKLG